MKQEIRIFTMVLLLACGPSCANEGRDGEYIALSEPQPDLGNMLIVRNVADESLLAKNLLVEKQRSALLFYREGLAPSQKDIDIVTSYCVANGIWVALLPTNKECGRRIATLVGIKQFPALLLVSGSGEREVREFPDNLLKSIKTYFGPSGSKP